MTLSLKESQALTELADRLYAFLPGKAHPYAHQSLSFQGVAARLGLGQHWSGGSKLPAITGLLRATLEVERGEFCPLVLAVIQQGLVYRRNKEPITREEIEDLNAIIAKLGYKIPDLHDPGFLDGLPHRGMSKVSLTDMPNAKAVVALQAKLTELHSLDPVKRGFAFEPFLSELFGLYDLAPRGSFRITGEQIDGSFVLDSETYLLEARWRNEQAANADLLTFAGKIDGKARWSRGLFVSYAGFSADGLQGFGQGRSTTLIGLDGLDLYHVLSGSLDLREVLRRKVRRAAETNRVFVPVRELFSNVT
jgi:hypothetical protein